MGAKNTPVKPKVLFLAGECNPQWHSLPALVAEYFRALLEHAELTLVTHVRNRYVLEEWLPPAVDVHYIDSERVSMPLYRFAQFLTGDPDKAMTLQVAFSYPANLYFEYRVWKQFRGVLRRGDFDLIHRVTPMSPTIPSPLAKWSPIPFVIGPVLGGLPWPQEFKGEMRREREWMNYFRAAHKCMPYYGSTYKNASAILAGYGHTVKDIPNSNHSRIIEFSEGGIHPEDFPERKFEPQERATILFVGRMVPFKQPEVLIRCFEKSEHLRNHRLVLVGDGPELDRLRELVSELGLSACVELPGSLPIEQVRELMYEADVFAFPSIREQGGGVLTMASMSSTPCVVVDYGGPSRRVPEGCGIKVPLGSVGQIIDGFVTALESLVDSPEKRQLMGLAARKFTKKYYSWDWKVKKTKEIYDWVLGRISDKPNFWAEINSPPNQEKEKQVSVAEQAAKISF